MRWVFCALLGSLLFLPSTSRAVATFQTDDFEDGLKANWTNGSGGGGGAILNIVPGGPAGAGDHYLQLSSGSFGGSTRMITFNDVQWAGDYTLAGVLQIAMDLKNFSGSGSVPMRIAIREASSSAGTPGYSSTTAFVVPADGAWHHAVFSLDASAMTPINSPAPYATDIANVADFRLLSSVAPATIGDAISAQIGVDNISTFQGVPEPSLCGTVGVLMLGSFMKRRRQAA